MKKIIIIAGLLASTSVWAAESDFYVLGAVGQTRLSYPQATTDAAIRALPATITSTATNNPTAYKLQLGYQLDDRWSIEGGYMDLGRISYQATGTTTGVPPVAISANETVKLTALNVNAVAAFPVMDSVSLLGKVGMTRMSVADTTNSALPGTLAKLWTANTRKTGMSYGMGLKVTIDKSFLVRADVDSYDTGAATGRVSVWSIGLGYHF